MNMHKQVNAGSDHLGRVRSGGEPRALLSPSTTLPLLESCQELAQESDVRVASFFFLSPAIAVHLLGGGGDEGFPRVADDPEVCATIVKPSSPIDLVGDKFRAEK
jgi:hypothetical protein